MYARIHLITQVKENTVVVKKDVILDRADGSYVFIADPNTNIATMQKVKTGIKVDDNVEIVEGINAGDYIVVKGQTLLSNGSKVNIINKAE